MNERLIAYFGTEEFACGKDPLRTRQTADRKFGSHRAKYARQTRNVDRRNQIQTQHGYRFSIVAEQKWTPESWSEPQTLFSEGELKVIKCDTDRTVQQTKTIDGSNRIRQRRRTVL